MFDAAKIQELLSVLQTLFSLQNLVLAGLCVVVLVWLWGRVRELRQPTEILAFETPNGRVTYARSALCDLVLKTASSLDGIPKCACQVVQDQGLVHLRLRLHLRATHSLPIVSEELKKRVTQMTRYTMGIQNLGNIDVQLAGLVGDIKGPIAPVADDANAEMRPL